jgi:hypothetical protein
MVIPGSRKEERSNMARNETRRIAPSVLQADHNAFAALKTLATYKPANDDFTVAKIQTAQEGLLAKSDIEAQRQADLDGARDDATAAEWAFHNAVLGAKDQVKAQFGADSNELQGLGLKKKSERKSPTNKNKSAPGPAPSPAPPK